MAILPDNEYTEFEGKYYIDPNVSLNEQNKFIDTLRSTQQLNNQQIKADTRNLGTDVPSNLGGLVGGEGYWTSRYQTPKTNSLVNDLRAVAQANALNQALSNEQEKWKTRYTRASNAASIRGSNGGGSNPQVTEGGVEKEDNSNETTAEIEPNEDGDTIEKLRDANGYFTGKERVHHPDGTYEDRDSVYSHDLPRGAGMSELWDKVSGRYNYTLTDDKGNTYEIEEGGNDEEVVKGDDGYYYLWDKAKNLWTRIVSPDDYKGKTFTSSGGGTWWRY